MELVRIVEALLFACQEPLTVAEIGRAIRETARESMEAAKESGEPADAKTIALEAATDEAIRASIDDLIAHYERDSRSFTLIERSSGWRLCARSEFAEWCRALYPGKKPSKLSAPALETLAIVAYRQPLTKSAIEAVRGVSVDAMMQQLLDRGLVRIEGRAELPGRPLLYSTTDLFLDHFGIRHLDDLPNATELRRVKLPTSEETAGAADSAPQPGAGESPALPLNLEEPAGLPA
jgi:segregation and condensation protein B